MTRSRRLYAAALALGAVLLVGVAVAAVLLAPSVWQGTLRPSPQSSSQTADAAPKTLLALGRIQPASGVVEIAGPPGDRIESISAAQGASVRMGQELIRFASHRLREIELRAARQQLADAEARQATERKLAEARIAVAQAALAKAQSYTDEIAIQQQRIAQLRVRLDLATSELHRLMGIPETLVPRQRLDAQQAAVLAADADVAAAEALLDKMRQAGPLSVQAAEADLVAARAALEQVDAAAGVKSLRVQEELAQLRLDECVLRAPADATVLQVLAFAGETVGQFPLVQLADLAQMVVIAEVYETDLRWISAGQTATIRSRAFPHPYDAKGLTGRVERVGQMISPPQQRSLDPYALADRRVAEVRIAIDAADAAVAARLVNLQVDVELSVERGMYEDAAGVAKSRP